VFIITRLRMRRRTDIWLTICISIASLRDAASDTIELELSLSGVLKLAPVTGARKRPSLALIET
jgi:hypothetical protein